MRCSSAIPSNSRRMQPWVKALSSAVSRVLSASQRQRKKPCRMRQQTRLLRGSVMMQPQSLQQNDQRARVRSLRKSADECRVRGQYRPAESVYQKALALAETTFGPDHLEVAVVVNNLAVLYKYTGNFDEASRLYR